MEQMMTIKHNKKTNRIIPYTLLFILSIVMLFPMLMIVNLSLKSYSEYIVDPIGIVKTINLDNYKAVWENLSVLQKFINTIVFAGISTLITVFTAAFAAYPLSRMHFKSANKFYVLILASMFFPGSLVANIVLMSDVFHVYGSPIALILKWSVGGVQLFTFMIVGFLKQVPRELDEVAYIDGSSYFKTVVLIIMPLMKPILVTIFMLKIIACWNDFLSPFIYVADPELKTLSTVLYMYMGQFSNKWNMMSATILIVSIPMILLYLFLQRFIIEGMTSGALKG